MAASDTIENMYDLALKPRLLRSLLKEYVPDLKHQFRNPSVLSYVVSAVKTHQLLSESAPPESDEKLIENWTVAVDSWINRVVALASSDTVNNHRNCLLFFGIMYWQILKLGFS